MLWLFSKVLKLNVDIYYISMLWLFSKVLKLNDISVAVVGGL